MSTVTPAEVAVPTPPASKDKADPRHVILFAAMIVGQFMAILDIQIVSASLTKIQAGLAASADEITWIQTSYLIAEVIMIPLSSFLCRWLSTRIVFVASAAGFTLASMWAGMSTSMDELIMARVAQGFLGGAMTPAVFANSRHWAQPAIWASSSLRYNKPQRLKPVSSPLSVAN